MRVLAIALSCAVMMLLGCGGAEPTGETAVADADGAGGEETPSPPPPEPAAQCDSMCHGTPEHCWREVPVTPPEGWYERGGAPLQNARESCDPACCAPES